jgi:hypothetical protein
MAHERDQCALHECSILETLARLLRAASHGFRTNLTATKMAASRHTPKAGTHKSATLTKIDPYEDVGSKLKSPVFIAGEVSAFVLVLGVGLWCGV